jgi:hypothetical protein
VQPKTKYALLSFSRTKKIPFIAISALALQDAPDYYALSYLWGPPGLPYYVFVDGKAIVIRENLYQCLQELRTEEGGCICIDLAYLWIDQTCINQSDVHERNSQVASMSTIYSQGYLVIVWLDDASVNLPEVARKVNSKGDFNSHYSLMKNAYFRRLWVVQEILLAKDIMMLCNGHV